MTDARELAELWIRGDEHIANAIVEPVATADGRGYVDFFDAAARKASIRKNSRDAEPTPNFDVPAWLDLEPGDYVLYRELGSDRVVLGPLDRDASTDWNPLTTPGQIIMAGEDGVPTVIEPPADVELNYVLQWNGTTQRPEWVEI